MAITRTPIIDDDGSGTTGTVIDNAWKQEFYGQIDAALGSDLFQTWTPVDGSGAGLVIGVTRALYFRLGRLVFIWAHVSYPATSSGLAAIIAGFPVANSASMYSGLYQTYGPASLLHLPASGTAMYLLNPATSVARAVSELSGNQVIFNGVYFTG